MAKYSKELDETLVERVKNKAAELGFTGMGITVQAIKLNKSKTSFGEVVKPNDFAKLFIADDYTIVVALYEDAFLLVDEQTQDIWIESLLDQVSYDSEKDKILLTKPELSLSLALYHKYKEIAPQKLELAYHTIQQIEEKKKEEREAQKERKNAKKNNK